MTIDGATKSWEIPPTHGGPYPADPDCVRQETADFRGKIELARLLLTLWASVSHEGSRSKTMINFTNLTQTVTAVVGAIVLSTAFVGASIGPVHASQIAQITTSAQAHA